jgi:hypothetical protein
MSVSLSHQGVITINGTPHADVISISAHPSNANKIDVSVNGKTSVFSAAGIRRFKVNGGAGNDSITEDASIIAPSILLGAAGNDTLVAGSGDDTLVGGAGNDSLEAGSGNDSLSGGAGDDSLKSGSGDCNLDAGKGNDHIGLNADGGVPLTQVPAAVSTGLTTLAQGATLASVQSFHEDGQTYYGTLVTISGQPTRIVVDASGQPVASGGNDDNGRDGEHARAFGSIVSVDAGAGKITLALTSEHGPARQTTFTVDPSAVITVDGVTATLGSLGTRTWVGIQLSPANPTTVIGITALSPRVEGVVGSLDPTANTLTVQLHHGGGTQTYNVSATAMITLDGAAALLSGITPGADVQLQLSASDANTVIGIRAESNSGGSGDSQGGQGGGGHDHSGGDN